MNITGLTNIQNIKIDSLLKDPNIGIKNPLGGMESKAPNFIDSLKEGFNNVSKIQENADLKIKEAVSASETELSEVMIATQKAEISLQLTMQIRNKVLEAYQEIMKMPI
jgi:flagellar hook-basal body complex protein FliE